ncbi:UNVERIFIED_CONTAM: hypothetical protein K2H54_034026 [Gekko kuhli]
MPGASVPTPSPPPPHPRGDSASSVVGSSASRKPDKTAKSPHKSTAHPTKEKRKPGKSTTGASDAPSGPPEPKRPKKSTPASTTVSSASVRPSDSTSVPTRPSDSELLTIEDPRYRHSDPELPPTDDRRSPAAHLSDIMLVPSRSPSLCSQPPSELFESDDARAPAYPDRQDWFRDTENVAPFYGSRSRSRRPSFRYSPEARSPSPNTYARYYYASSLATGIALRRHAWLRTAHLPDDIKAKVEDLPFDGEGLFHTTTDQYLTSIDDSRKTAKRLGFFSATPSKPKQRTWTPRYQ